MPETICQSCGMPMAAKTHFGTLSDQSHTEEYCCFCFQNGTFTDQLSLEENIRHWAEFHDESEKQQGHTVTRHEAMLMSWKTLPSLRRWQSHRITHLSYYEAVNRAVDYINAHLSETITLRDLAAAGRLSEYHFHRIFKAILNESPGDYIQRLRMEKAAFSLQTTRLPLSQIALQVGYQSPQALSKSFKKYFGMTPSAFRLRPGELNVSVPPIEEIPLEVEIHRLEPQEVLSYPITDPFRRPHAFTEAWQKLIRFARVEGIPDEQHRYFCLSRDISVLTRPDHYRAFVCLAAPGLPAPAGRFARQTLEGGTYAVFRYTGPYHQMDKLYCNIYRYWIPASEYELRDCLYFEEYLNTPDRVPEEQLETRVYIPVQKISGL